MLLEIDVSLRRSLRLS